MTYLINTSGAASVTIGGVDYTSSLREFTCSDSSANRNGFVVTTGEVVLGKTLGGFNPKDYDRNAFRRGQVVIIDVVAEGTTVRHPRGYLYVISTTYDVASETMTVSVGCQIALCTLTDNIEPLLPLAPTPLDPARQNIQAVQASFQADGSYLFQNNQGQLVANRFFGGDTAGNTAPGEWVSVLGQSTVDVAPLSAGSIIPDEISLTYAVPTGALAGDFTGKVDESLSDSYYFLDYPAISFARAAGDEAPGVETIEVGDGVVVTVNRTGGDDNPSNTGSLDTVGNAYTPPGGDAGTAVSAGGRQSSCGNVAAPSAGASGPGSCNEGYETVQQAVFLPARRKTYQITYFDGPAGQQNRSVSDTYVPAVEVQGGYYADKFAACRFTWSDGCNPNGNCPYDGMDLVLASRVITTTEFGPANEVVKTETDTYETLLGAASTADWRSGSVGGNPVDFRSDLKPYAMFLSKRVTETYSKDGDRNIVTQVQLDSMVSRKGGDGNRQSEWAQALTYDGRPQEMLDRQTMQPTISVGPVFTNIPDVDALSNGIETKRVQTSVTTATIPLLPDSVNSSTTAVQDKMDTLIVSTGRYEPLPEGVGPYVLEERAPVPFLYTTQAEIDAAVGIYGDYILGFTKGDAFGLSIVESLRKDIVNNWRPGMPMRFSDVDGGVVQAMRMDACQWGVTLNESFVGFNGIWQGTSNGTVTVTSNVQGNTTPGGSPAPDPGPGPSIEITDETAVDGGSYIIVVQQNMNLTANIAGAGPGGRPIVPNNPPGLDGLNTINLNTMVSYVAGVVAGPGGVLATAGNGSIPVEYNGSLITSVGAIVINDVFA